MLTNSSLTIYHKYLDETTRLEKWARHNYNKIWWFGGRGAGINKGYDNANDVEIRIPFDKNIVDTSSIQIGDILVKGTLTTDINSQQDLSNYEVYNITSININNFGGNKHIHIGGR